MKFTGLLSIRNQKNLKFEYPLSLILDLKWIKVFFPICTGNPFPDDSGSEDSGSAVTPKGN